MGTSRTCRSVRSRLLDFVENELSAAEQRSVEGHLEACAACRAELGLLRAALEAVQQVQSPAPSPTFWANYVVGVRERIGRSRGPRPFRVVPALGLAAAAVLLVVLVQQVWMGRSTQRIVLPDEGSVSLYASDLDYLELADALGDSSDMLQTVTQELLSGDVEGMGDYVAGEVSVEGTGGWGPFDSAIEDYLMDTSNLEDLIEQIDEDDQSELLREIDRLSTV